MKKLLLLLISGFIIVTSGYSQISQKKIENLYNHTFQIIQSLKNVSPNDANFDVIGKICVENWELDSLDNLVKSSDGLITIEKLSGGRYLVTQEGDFAIDSVLTHITSEVYLNNADEFENDESIDSLLIYFTQNGVKALFSKQINDFENGNLVKSTNYVDYTSFGIPTGLVLSGYTDYYYDNKDFLISEATYTSSFWDGTTGVSDSIFYTNNSKGDAIESLLFEVNYDGILQPTEKHLYEYNGDDKLVKEEIYLNPEDWTLAKRKTTKFISKISVNLSEETFDKGATWTPTSRDSTYFTKDLPLGFPNRTAYETYDDNGWKINSVTINKDCSGTYTDNIEKLSFVSRFDNDDIVITADQIINNANVTLYNSNGQVIFNHKFRIVPERINTTNLLPGIYILEINSNDFRGVNKLIKF